MTAPTWRRAWPGVTFTEGLPAHWSALVRRNLWGTWSGHGLYAGPRRYERIVLRERRATSGYPRRA